ncbi:hypothetical protein SDC9_92904 [bioreactor metagenome]|uniref:Uncharacterized protein n=1 Tax=bioreactor metagenome TaxID=1076179 RepID=A0A644ZZX6_9ZZZZ
MFPGRLGHFPLGDVHPVCDGVLGAVLSEDGGHAHFDPERIAVLFPEEMLSFGGAAGGDLFVVLRHEMEIVLAPPRIGGLAVDDLNQGIPRDLFEREVDVLHRCVGVDHQDGVR